MSQSNVLSARVNRTARETADRVAAMLACPDCDGDGCPSCTDDAPAFADTLIAVVPAPDCGRHCCGCYASPDAQPDDLCLACSDCWAQYVAHRREQGEDFEIEEFECVEAFMRAHQPASRDWDQF
jgi:hypothetical protein